MSSTWTCRVGERDRCDVVVAAPGSQKVVGPGCLLNQFAEPMRAVQDCVVIDVDKKELKKLCMLLRWKYFGVGATNCALFARLPRRWSSDEADRLPGLRGPAGVRERSRRHQADGVSEESSLRRSAARVVLTAVDSMAQAVQSEEFTTKDVRTSPYFWGESFRFGGGAMGLEVLAGIRVQVVQGLGRVLGEGMLPLDVVFGHLDGDGYGRQVLRLKNDLGGSGSMFLTLKGLGMQAMALSLQEKPLEDIAVSRQPEKASEKPADALLQKITERMRKLDPREAKKAAKEEETKAKEEEKKAAKGEAAPAKPAMAMMGFWKPKKATEPVKPTEPGAELPPAPEGDSRAKQAMNGFLARIGLGKQVPPPKPVAEEEEQPRRRRRFEDEEEESPRPRRRFQEEEYEEEEELPEERPRRMPRRNPRFVEEPRRPRAPRRPRVESISSSSSSESDEEPPQPEGKPTPFNHLRRIPYVRPLVRDPSGNPFARSCGNPFEFVGLAPPTPQVALRPGAAFGLYDVPVETEEDLPAEKAKIVPRPGYNPFAAMKEGDYGKVDRRLHPLPGYNPFDIQKPKTITINGKQRTNPFI